MGKNQNIEDLFKNNLNNLDVEPTSRVWENVNSNLWFSNIQNLFYNYTVQPASNAWQKIVFRLWIRDFIVFSPKSFNVYYLSAILLISSAFLSSYFYDSYNKVVEFSDIKNKNQDFFKLPENSNTLSASNLIHSSVNGSSSKNITSINNEENLIASALNNNKEIKKKETLINQENFSDNLSVHEPILVNDELLNETIIRDNSYLMKMSNRYVTLYPELFSETNFENRIEKEYFNTKWHLSLESYVMRMYGSSVYKITDNEASSFNKNYGGSKSTPTFSGGILFQAKHLNFSFQTGLTYSKFKDKPDYKFLSTSYSTSLVTQIIPDYNYNYFEVEILNLDSLLLNHDSVWITILDSTLITTYDTIVKQQTIQTNTIDHKKTINSFSYFEIPLIAGYTFSQGQLSFTLRAGIITGILSTFSGYTPSPYSEVGTSEIKNTTTRKIMFSGIAGIEASYNATKNISIIAAPVYRFNLLSLYKKDNIINQRFNNYGIKLGIRYNFK